MQLQTIQLNKKKFQLPNFVPSISSIKTNYHPIDYLKLLVQIKYPTFLISAYDVCYSFNSHLSEFNSLLELSEKNNQIIFLDSGNYEFFWNLPFNPWTDSLYYKRLENLRVDFSFSFDGAISDHKNYSSEICDRVLKQETFAGNSIVIPIVKPSNEKLAEIVVEVVKKLDPVLIAIPERILGEGILGRCKQLKNIRSKLDSLGKYYPIHLLGTGNPRSILLYILAGADCFDGLEWCQTFVEPNTGILYHFQQADLFLEDLHTEMNYTTKVLVNNLEFYNSFINSIHKSIQEKSFNDLLQTYFEKDFIIKLNSLLK